MRIGIVCYPTYGGSGVVATELGRFLAERGHEVHFISSAMPFRLVHQTPRNIYFHEVQSLDYPVLHGDLYGITLASKIVQVVEAFGLDIVHAHYAVPHAISAFLARSALSNAQSDFGVVTTLHGTDITLTGRAPSFFPICQYAINRSEAVTTVSEWLREETISAFDIKRPIEVVPNFVDAGQFRRGLTPCKRAQFAPRGEKILLHISNFRPVKRVGDAVRVFAKVAQEVPAVLLMVGDGPERDAAQALARQLGVAKNALFLGKQEEIEHFMSCADAFLFPSEYESFGLAALEAMACELPVVTTTGGGLPEVIAHGETGFTAPVGDIDAMAGHALSVLRDAREANRIGRNARAAVLENYTPDRIIPMYEALYERALRRASPVRVGVANGGHPLMYADGI